MSRGSPWLMSCCTIRAQWAGEIDCLWDRNQLSGADYQNNRISPPQGMGPRQIVMDEDQLITILNGGDISEETPDDNGESIDTSATNDEDFTEEQI